MLLRHFVIDKNYAMPLFFADTIFSLCAFTLPPARHDWFSLAIRLLHIRRYVSLIHAAFRHAADAIDIATPLLLRYAFRRRLFLRHYAFSLLPAFHALIFRFRHAIDYFAALPIFRFFLSLFA